MTAAKAPPEALLMDYAAGTASPAISLLVASHLAMSAESRGLFALMQSVGGALLDDSGDEPLERISAAGTLALAESGEQRPAHGLFSDERTASPPIVSRGGVPVTFDGERFPAPLKRAEAASGGDQRWHRLGVGVAVTKLAVSTGKERAHLLWAKGGAGIATHRHVGREVILVLQGAFWDNDIRYEPGDVTVSEDGTIHGPRVDHSEDCVCLAITEAPVHFTGLPGIILNRFCRF